MEFTWITFNKLTNRKLVSGFFGLLFLRAVVTGEGRMAAALPSFQNHKDIYHLNNMPLKY
jgi:hypothetical protein